MNLICINCPRGCNLEVTKVNEDIVVKGNFCPKGKKYGESELINPTRTVTTTVSIDSINQSRLPVISSSPVRKDKVLEVVKALKDVKVKAPINRGDIIVNNINNLNVDIIASKTVKI